MSGCQDPYMNMSMDEALLESVSKSHADPVLRIYGWFPHAISYGRFQDISEVMEIGAVSAGRMPFVRRMTGGSIVYHGTDISYSVCCRQEDLVHGDNVKGSFMELGSFLKAAYQNLGIDGHYSVGGDDKYTKKTTLCMAKKEEHDLLANGLKIGGSSQRRRRSCILQHGFIILDGPSHCASYRCPGLSQIMGYEIDFFRMQDVLIQSFKNTYNVKLLSAGPTEYEMKTADMLIAKKYSTYEWNYQGKRNAGNIKEASLAK